MSPGGTRFAATLIVGAAAIGVWVASARAAAPVVGDTWATGVTATAARLHAEVTPTAPGNTYRFEYLAAAARDANLEAGRDPFLGAAKAPTVGVLQAATRSQAVSGLSPETRYAYRAVAANADGTTPGPTRFLLTQSPGTALRLLDDRAWELVSRVDKNGGEVLGLGGGASLLQSSSGGNAVSFGSHSSFAGDAGGAAAVSQYLARRGPAGWDTENLTVPQVSAGYGEAAGTNPFKLFATDLDAAIVSNGQRCRGLAGNCPVANPPLAGSGAPAGYRNYYRRNAGGGFGALLEEADVAGLPLGPDALEMELVGASPDLRHAVVSSCGALTADAVEVPAGPSCDPAATNLYLWSPAGLELINLLPGASVGTPGADLAAPARAVSADGSRVYWSEAGILYLWVGGASEQVDQALTGSELQTASDDGSVAFFTRSGHLYRFDAAAGSSLDLTPAGGVEGVLGASADGARVYYVTDAGVFLREGSATVPVAAAAAAINYPPATGTARVTPDGRHLAFVSSASLTGYDNLGQDDGQPTGQVYRFDADAHGLVCVSCNPTLGRPLGPSTLPAATVADSGPDAVPARKPRALSDDGSRVFFDSADALVLQDTNNRPDVYEWESFGAGSCSRPAGCVNLISSGRSSGGAVFADASASGGDAFFLTDGSLDPLDLDAVDLYDARANGGFPQAPTQIPCDGDACQSLPSPPEDPTPATLAAWPGNGPLRIQQVKPAKKKKHTKHRKKRRAQRARADHRGGRR